MLTKPRCESIMGSRNGNQDVRGGFLAQEKLGQEALRHRVAKDQRGHDHPHEHGQAKADGGGLEFSAQCTCLPCLNHLHGHQESHQESSVQLGDDAHGAQQVEEPAAVLEEGQQHLGHQPKVKGRLQSQEHRLLHVSGRRKHAAAQHQSHHDAARCMEQDAQHGQEKKRRGQQCDRHQGRLRSQPQPAQQTGAHPQPEPADAKDRTITDVVGEEMPLLEIREVPHHDRAVVDHGDVVRIHAAVEPQGRKQRGAQQEDQRARRAVVGFVHGRKIQVRPSDASGLRLRHRWPARTGSSKTPSEPRTASGA